MAHSGAIWAALLCTHLATRSLPHRLTGLLLLTPALMLSIPLLLPIVRQEEEALERRSSSERLADAVGVFAGSLLFVVLHLGRCLQAQRSPTS
jgi:hypothetical protein